MSKLPPLPHWCEPGSPFAEQMQAYATAATEPLLQRIAELESLLTEKHSARVMWQSKAAELERQLEEARKDAELYRQLRNGSNWPAVFASHDAPEPLRGEELDAAMQKGQS